MKNDIGFFLVLISFFVLAFVFFDTRRMNNKIKELEEWWSAHHKVTTAIDSGDYNFDTSEYWIRRNKATAAIGVDSNGIILQPGESFTDTVTFSQSPVWMVKYQKMSEAIAHWIDTSDLKKHLPIMKKGDPYYDTTDHRIKLIP